MLNSINDQLTEIYVFIDDYLKAHSTLAHWRCSNNDEPLFSDAEVLTIALMQGYFGCATLKRTYNLVVANARDAFPLVCGYKQWLARLHALTALTGQLALAAAHWHVHALRLYRLDSKPIPLCHDLRLGRVRLLRDDGAHFGKTTKGWFFGFKLHAIVNHCGQVVGALLTPGNLLDADAAPALAGAVEGGLALADRAYSKAELRALLLDETDLLVLTPADASGHAQALISSLRERVETTFSQLWSRFVDRVYSRSWEGLWSTIKLKLLHLNLCLAKIITS